MKLSLSPLRRFSLPENPSPWIRWIVVIVVAIFSATYVWFLKDSVILPVLLPYSVDPSVVLQQHQIDRSLFDAVQQFDKIKRSNEASPTVKDVFQ